MLVLDLGTKIFWSWRRHALHAWDHPPQFEMKWQASRIGIGEQGIENKRFWGKGRSRWWHSMRLCRNVFRVDLPAGWRDAVWRTLRRKSRIGTFFKRKDQQCCACNYRDAKSIRVWPTSSFLLPTIDSVRDLWELELLRLELQWRRSWRGAVTIVAYKGAIHAIGDCIAFNTSRGKNDM